MHSKAWLDARQQGDASFLASRSFRTFTAYSLNTRPCSISVVTLYTLETVWHCSFFHVQIQRIRQVFLSLLTIFQKERSISQQPWINCDRILRNDNLHISFSGNVPWNNPIPRTTKRREDEGAAASTNRSRARALDFPLEIIPLVHKESFSARCSGQIAPLLHRLIAFTRGKVR